MTGSSHPSSSHPSTVHDAPRSTDGRAARLARLRRAGGAAALALGSALAGAAGTAHHIADAAPAPPAPTAASEPGGNDAAGRAGLSLTLHSEERRAAEADGGASLERIRTLQFSWRPR